MHKDPEFAEFHGRDRPGRIVALDIGTKRCGVAISDELRITVRPLCTFARTNWKQLLLDTSAIIADYDAAALVLGLPLENDGSDSALAADVRDLARKFSLSLTIPVLLQDEAYTTYEARARIWHHDAPGDRDSVAATVILEDLIDRLELSLDGRREHYG